MSYISLALIFALAVWGSSFAVCLFKQQKWIAIQLEIYIQAPYTVKCVCSVNRESRRHGSSRHSLRKGWGHQASLHQGMGSLHGIRPCQTLQQGTSQTNQSCTMVSEIRMQSVRDTPTLFLNNKCGCTLLYALY